MVYMTGVKGVLCRSELLHVQKGIKCDCVKPKYVVFLFTSHVKGRIGTIWATAIDSPVKDKGYRILRYQDGQSAMIQKIARQA